MDLAKPVGQTIRPADPGQGQAIGFVVFGRSQATAGFGGPEHRLVVHADRFERGRFLTDDRRPVEVREFEGDRPVRRVAATTALTRSAVGASLSDPMFDLVLYDCEVTDLRQEAAVNVRAELTVPGLFSQASY